MKIHSENTKSMLPACSPYKKRVNNIPNNLQKVSLTMKEAITIWLEEKKINHYPLRSQKQHYSLT